MSLREIVVAVGGILVGILLSAIAYRALLGLRVVVEEGVKWLVARVRKKRG